MRTLIWLSALLLPLTATAGKLSLLQADEVSVTYSKMLGHAYSPLTTSNVLSGRLLNEKLVLTINATALNYVFLENRVVSSTDKDFNGTAGQFRTVGWNYKVGLRLSRHIEVYYEHFSEHVLDTEYKVGHLPLEDSLGVRIFIYKDDRRKDTVF